MTLTGFKYVCSAGETFDSIARELWEDENYASDLMCANPEYCTKQVFTGGEEIYIPVVELPEDDMDEEITEPKKAPWRE